MVGGVGKEMTFGSPSSQPPHHQSARIHHIIIISPSKEMCTEREPLDLGLEFSLFHPIACSPCPPSLSGEAANRLHRRQSICQAQEGKRCLQFILFECFSCLLAPSGLEVRDEEDETLK